MNKAELIDAMAEGAGISKGDAKKCTPTDWQLTQNQQQLTLKDKTAC